jgi:AcrR family transcriptional regulator
MKDSRELILMEAYKLFLQKSFKEVTMNEIMGKAGLSKAAFYHHFTSKEQVFKEVITHFYLNAIKTDFNTFSHQSLKEFIQDNFKAINSMSSFFKGGKGEESIGINYFLPMFDAIRLMPDIIGQFVTHQENELNAWVKIIKIAKKKGEIKSTLKDEQLAKLFIYAADGVGISSILRGKGEKMAKELLSMWEGIYAGIKT